jgi:tetratricopeptide (TPR) repeat protein
MPTKVLFSHTVWSRLPGSSILTDFRSHWRRYACFFGWLVLLATMFVCFNAAANLLEVAYQKSQARSFWVPARINLAEQFYQFGHLSEAEGELQAITNSPFLSWQLQQVPSWKKKYTTVQYQVGTKDRLQQEVRQWEKYLTTNPGNTDLYLRLSNLYWQLQEPEKAQASLQQAIFIDPTNKELQQLISQMK